MNIDFLDILIDWIQNSATVIYAWFDHHEHPKTIHIYHNGSYDQHKEPMPIFLASLKIELHRATPNRHRRKPKPPNGETYEA